MKKYCLSLLFVSLLIITQTAYAEKKNINFKQQINLLKTAKKASVYISSQPYIGVTSVEVVKHHNCKFDAKEVKNIGELVKMLKQAEFRKTPSNQSHLPVIGMVIELVFHDASTMEFVFGREYVNEETINVEFTYLPEFNNISLLASRQMYRGIYDWIKDDEVIAIISNPDKWKSSFDCEQSRSRGWIKDEKSYLSCLSRRQGKAR